MVHHQRELCTYTYGNIFGGIPKSFLQFSQILMASDKTIHKAFRFHEVYKQNQLEIFIFTIYQNYIGFIFPLTALA